MYISLYRQNTTIISSADCFLWGRNLDILSSASETLQENIFTTSPLLSTTPEQSEAPARTLTFTDLTVALAYRPIGSGHGRIKNIK